MCEPETWRGRGFKTVHHGDIGSDMSRAEPGAVVPQLRGLIGRLPRQGRGVQCRPLSPNGPQAPPGRYRSLLSPHVALMAIRLKSRKEIDLMRAAGRIVHEVHNLCRDMAVPGTTTRAIDDAAQALIDGARCPRAVQELPDLPARRRLPLDPVHQRERVRGARHRRRPPDPGRRRGGGGLRRAARRLVRRRRHHHPRGQRGPRGRQDVRGHRALPADRHRPDPPGQAVEPDRPADAEIRRRPRLRRGPRLSWVTASDPRCTKSPRCPISSTASF